jgi:hypothetical protein
MPDVTPIYNWPIPEDTDLVKDGAEAIRDLAGAIETTVDSSPTGLVHIKTESIGSGVSSISLGSDADPLFSSDYDVYFFTFITGAGSTAGVNVNARLRENVTDSSGSNYVTNEFFNTGSTAQAALGTTTFWKIGYAGNVGSVINGFIFNPFATERTFFTTDTFADSTTPTLIQGRLAGEFNSTTSFNGITFLRQSGTFTGGNIRFYGVQN